MPKAEMVERLTDILAKFYGFTGKRLPDDVCGGKTPAGYFRRAITGKGEKKTPPEGAALVVTQELRILLVCVRKAFDGFQWQTRGVGNFFH